MLYRTNTAQPVFAIRREIDRLFDDTFGSGSVGRTAWVPAADVSEDAEAYHFDMEMPGIAPDEVEVTADQGVLTVRGEKRQRSERDDERARLHVTERSFGSFTRAFQLPQGADENDVSATFEDGLLSIRVAKRARPQPRRVPINSRKGASNDRRSVGAGRGGQIEDGGRDSTGRGEQANEGVTAGQAAS